MLSDNIRPAVLLGLLACAFCGCRSLPPQPPMDFSGPGWILRQGQAVWQPGRKTSGVAGDLLVAIHPDGRSVVQFTKTPLPFIAAQRTDKGWQVEILPRHKTYAANGSPPARLIWLHLPEAIRHGRAPQGFAFTPKPGGGWRFERLASGESLEGYLDADQD